MNNDTWNSDPKFRRVRPYKLHKYLKDKGIEHVFIKLDEDDNRWTNWYYENTIELHHIIRRFRVFNLIQKGKTDKYISLSLNIKERKIRDYRKKFNTEGFY